MSPGRRGPDGGRDTGPRRAPQAAGSPTAAGRGTGSAPPAPPTPAELAAWIAAQRWSALPAAAPDAASGTGPAPGPAPEVAAVPLGTDPAVAVSLVQLPGDHRYQLVTGALADGSPGPRPERGRRPTAGTTAPTTATAPVAPPPAPDRADDPAVADALGRFVARDGRAASPAGVVSAHWLPGAAPPGDGPARPLGAEQSNTSVVVGGTHVLKVIRRLRPGPHPEVEIGRHLAAVAADPTAAPGVDPVPVAPLAGWYQLEEPDGTTTVLGTVHELVPGALDGWSLTLSALAGDPNGFLTRLHALGGALARLHGALARRVADDPDGPTDAATSGTRGADPADPDRFGAVPLPPHRLDAVVAGLADALAHLPDEAASDGLPLDLADRGPEIVHLARSLAARVGTDTGAGIRHHGDLHLGQTLVGPDGWVVLDFEGEPARPLEARRQRHSPLRDVAGMLRSFAYAAATHRRAGGRPLATGWEPAARAAFLDGYLAAVDPALLPTSAPATRDLLALFELEKVVYEVGYEAAHRPDWLAIPVDGLHRLLGSVPS